MKGTREVKCCLYEGGEELNSSEAVDLLVNPHLWS